MTITETAKPLTPAEKGWASRRAFAARRAVIAASRGTTPPVRLLPANVIDIAAVRAARAASVAARIQAATPDWSARFAELTEIWARGRVRAVPAQPAPYRSDGTARGALEYLCGCYGVPT